MKNNKLNGAIVLLSEDEMINIEGGGFWSDLGYAFGYVLGRFARAQVREEETIGGPSADHG